ncbi:7867_t:CDS:1, partial [Cetraspora pellucida]
MNQVQPLIPTSYTPNKNIDNWLSALKIFKVRKDQIQHNLKWKELWLRIK